MKKAVKIIKIKSKLPRNRTPQKDRRDRLARPAVNR